MKTAVEAKVDGRARRGSQVMRTGGRRAWRSTLLEGRPDARMEIVAMRAAREYFNAALSDGPVDVNAKVIHLPRGGVYCKTSVGAVQIGSPPETIKDAMALGLSVPTHFIIPLERFSLRDGLSVSEVEFPAYFNFFILGKSINIVTTKEGEGIVRDVFAETLTCDCDVNVETEFGRFATAEELDAAPDIHRESDYFSKPKDMKPISIDALMRFTHFDENLTATLGDGVTVSIEAEGSIFVVRDGGEEVMRCPTVIMLPPPREDPSRGVATAAFRPPSFGVTVLGASHGFDPQGTTSGFVIWVHGRGVCVDPPPHTIAALAQEGISPRQISAVILTHCHADHDAGTFQKLLMETRVLLMTTPTIKDSFLRKYSRVTGLEQSFLAQLLEFRPARLGQPNFWRGAELRFFYALHTIPCMGFEVHYKGKSLVYSADTLNDPDRIRAMQKEGVLSEGRADSLVNFPWHHDLILHEAGVPPIHTPIAALQALPEEVKERLCLIHISEKDAKSSGLRYARTGVEHTIVLDTEEPAPAGGGAGGAGGFLAAAAHDDIPGMAPGDLQAPAPAAGGTFADAADALDAVLHTDLFQGLSISDASEVLLMCRSREYAAGETVAERGTHAEALMVIREGTVRVDIPLTDERSLHTKLDSVKAHWLEHGAESTAGSSEPPSEAGSRRSSVISASNSSHAAYLAGVAALQRHHCEDHSSSAAGSVSSPSAGSATAISAPGSRRGSFQHNPGLRRLSEHPDSIAAAVSHLDIVTHEPPISPPRRSTKNKGLGHVIEVGESLESGLDSASGAHRPAAPSAATGGTGAGHLAVDDASEDDASFKRELLAAQELDAHLASENALPDTPTARRFDSHPAEAGATATAGGGSKLDEPHFNYGERRQSRSPRPPRPPSEGGASPPAARGSFRPVVGMRSRSPLGKASMRLQARRSLSPDGLASVSSPVMAAGVGPQGSVPRMGSPTFSVNSYATGASGGRVLTKFFSAGDVIGEASLILGAMRSFDIVATTNVRSVELSRAAFYHLIERSPELADRIVQLADMRASTCYWALQNGSEVTRCLTGSQMTQLLAIVTERKVPQGSYLWRAGETALEAILVGKGGLKFAEAQDQDPFTTGTFVADFLAMRDDKPLDTSLYAQLDSVVYVVERAPFIRFLDNNPGLLINFLKARVVE
mmetsp:Transcript_916/g.2529  ORF Transcript_916/g.2529 Transcript_916/m.2529 type:complete len:1171 (-) Transcript_916:46-3558(-)|eukprot:CAMPEP_0185157692 /NCGR_PEP_ID=MMETSP1139-20130426/1932_1 /TAXON_ID=298111 /ORGANISM="Pavlova sp., Strain CCMP459" /LENGTH=1170 /DNA_ID=CAMNT_0027722789 /DNA_START=23 /DNA_END=3535 /DNA_ORIENTATION=-